MGEGTRSQWGDIDATLEELSEHIVSQWTTDKPKVVHHDFLLIMKAMEQYNIDGRWHNTAYEIMMAELFTADKMPEMERLIILGKFMGFELDVFLSNVINEAFGVGYMLGEGEEHIEKCLCHKTETGAQEN